MKKLKVPPYDWDLVAKLAKHPNPQGYWNNTGGYPRHFKDALTEKLKIIQDNRCAYCSTELFGSEIPRDHIAPKEKYGLWTFRPENVVLACSYCNSERKKVYNPIIGLRRKYKKCVFEFVHPYLDNPDQHLAYKGALKAILISSKTPKGEKTIDLFDLASPERTKQRASDCQFFEIDGTLHGRWRTLYEAAKTQSLKPNLEGSG